MAPQANILGIRDASTDSEGEDSSSPPARASVRTATRVAGVKRKYSAVVDQEEKDRRAEAKATKEAEAREKRKRLVVGIDFGTTNSGIAYVNSTKAPDQVKVICKWNGGANDILEKVPTIMAYAFENDFAEDKWGYDVKPGMMTSSFFKLLLDSATKPSDFDDPLLLQSVGSGLLRLPPGKNALDVCSDYLRHLYKHVMESLEGYLKADALDQTPILFELTLPATWSHVARSATRQAAIRAGFESRKRDALAMIDEPEAAALAVLHSTIDTFEEKQPFKAGGGVLVCDIGGGTADIVSYKIVKMDPLQLEEATMGEGCKMGGTTVDRNLHLWLTKTFGRAFSELLPHRLCAGSHLMQDFETAKREFRGPGLGGPWQLRCKMVEAKIKEKGLAAMAKYDGGEHGEDVIKLTSDDMVEFFLPVVETVYKLIRRQLKRVKKARMPPITTIVLCGGLGSSPYIKDQFEHLLKEDKRPEIGIVTPEKPWSAISRGAAIRGLDKKPPVTFYRARDHIGITVRRAFDENIHLEQDRCHCPLLGDRAKDQMEWHVARGARLSPNTKKTIKCYVVVLKDDYQGPVVVYQDLYSCTSNEPPTRNEDPITKVGQIKMELTDIVNKEKKRYKKENNGALPDKIDLDIKIIMTLGSDKGVLLVTAKVNMKQVGSTSIVYESDPAWKASYIAD